MANFFVAFLASVVTLVAGQCMPVRDGQYQLASAGKAAGRLYYSSDFGTTWTPAANSPTNGWWNLQVTSTGTVMFAGTFNSGAYVSVTAGASWLPIPGSFLTASSATAQFQLAANRSSDQQPYDPAALLVSADAGATWTQVFPPEVGYFFSAAVSHTGQYMTVISRSDGAIYHSTDFGRTWNQSIVPSGSTNFVNLAVSGSGQYQLVMAQYSQLLISTDYGNTLHTANVSAQAWEDGALSCSGEFQVAVAKQGGTVWLSVDYGRTWGVPSGVPSMATYWWVDMSCSGQYITAAGADPNGGLVVSTDYGVTWTLTQPGLDWTTVSINKVMCD